MSKFDAENMTIENQVLATDSHQEHNPLQRALSTLPTLSPTQDRLDTVLRALAAKRESTHSPQAKSPLRRPLRNYRVHLMFALAASFMLSVTALFLRPSPPTAANLVVAPNTIPAGKTPEASSEIAQLMAVSQHLEAGLRDLGQGSASFSQLYGRKQAELSLATLDTDLAEVMASNSGQAIDQQRALWRERVAVLSAVESGDYRQALFVVD